MIFAKIKDENIVDTTC